jgi:hypothetical protein
VLSPAYLVNLAERQSGVLRLELSATGSRSLKTHSQAESPSVSALALTPSLPEVPVMQGLIRGGPATFPSRSCSEPK